MNAKKIAALNVSPACKAVLKNIVRTRNTRAVGFIVRQAIARRTELLGQEFDACEFDLGKIKEAKSRKRVAAMLEAVSNLNDRKDLSVLCACAINQRKAIRVANAS